MKDPTAIRIMIIDMTRLVSILGKLLVSEKKVRNIAKIM